MGYVEGDSGERPRSTRPAVRLLGPCLVAALGLVACVGGSSTTESSTPSRSAGHRTSAPTGAMIPQPSLSTLNDVTRRRLAPNSARIDLAMPSFSDPTNVTNPLFPIRHLDAVILGEVQGRPLKIETTLLPETKTVGWNGRQIEALQSQFCAYLEGHISEVAVDLYAQADDGSVWYFGEDVVDYAHGVAATTDGTWRVGLDGPAAMIMPGNPKVGDVYRTENIPGVAFEQVTIKRVGVTVAGPVGPVEGAVIGQELHQDERALEPKIFAPGYGEFFSGGDHDFEANALSVPVDALSGPTPAELMTLTNGAYDVADSARSGDWSAASAILERMTSAWEGYRTGRTPVRLGAQMSVALDEVAGAVSTRDARAAPQAALDVADAALDLRMQYEPPAHINLARFELWARRLRVDAAAEDAANVRGDVTTLGWIRDRIELDSADGNGIDDQLRLLGSVADAHEFAAAEVQAERLLATLTGLAPMAAP